MNEPAVRVYDSLGSDYERAFAVFLAHTNQKDQARTWLDRLVEQLPARQAFLDAGAGNGKVTAWFAPRFSRTMAIEPNPHLRRELAECCPAATILPEPILDAAPPAQADFVLLSHVLYYIPAPQWVAHLDRLASFVAPGGALVVVLQNPHTDCLRMIRHFHRHEFDLRSLADTFAAGAGGRFTTSIETVESHIATGEFQSAYTVAEFMLNLLPFAEPIPRAALEDYVRQNFATPEGGYRFSCSQDFLVVRR